MFFQLVQIDVPTKYYRIHRTKKQNGDSKDVKYTLLDFRDPIDFSRSDRSRFRCDTFLNIYFKYVPTVPALVYRCLPAPGGTEVPKYFRK